MRVSRQWVDLGEPNEGVIKYRFLKGMTFCHELMEYDYNNEETSSVTISLTDEELLRLAELTEVYKRVEKVRRLVDEAEETLEALCSCCRRLNPQHKDCTMCPETELLRKLLLEFKEGGQ
jgi:hypothetical protein